MSKKISDEFLAAGQNVRKYYQRRLPANPIKDYYYILRDTPNNESIIVEYGFADSSLDDVGQIINNYETLTEAVVKAVADYLGIKYIQPSTDKNTYTVVSGDSLYKIAKKYNTTVDKIKQLNNLSTDLLKIGQVLNIPSTTNIIDSTYTVKKGDTLWSIAKKNGLSVNELKSINGLSTNMLSIGQVLKLNNEEVMEPLKENQYIVKPGDTLYGISIKYNINVDELKKYNNLTSNVLKIGQVINIPAKEYKIYTVEKGDTLYSISRKFNTFVSGIIELNNLTSTKLSVGQKLIIP